MKERKLQLCGGELEYLVSIDSASMVFGPKLNEERGAAGSTPPPLHRRAVHYLFLHEVSLCDNAATFHINNSI